MLFTAIALGENKIKAGALNKKGKRNKPNTQIYRQTDRQTNSQPASQPGRQEGRQAGRQTDNQTGG